MTEDFLSQKWLDSDRGKICYFFWRYSDSAPTIVFLHGLSSNHTTWSRAAQIFKQYGFNLLLLDLRGHGYSDKTKNKNLYKFSVFKKDLEEIIRQEKLAKLFLIGYSFGGFIAMDLAILHQEFVGALVLISANHTNPFKYKKIHFLTWPTYYFLRFLAWIFLWQRKKQYYYFDQAHHHGYWQSTFKGFITMPISVNLWMLSEIANIDFSKEIESISCPTLIIKSESDPFLSLAEMEDMARKIKDSKKIVVEESSHFLATRYQDKISQIIIEFFKEKGLI